MTECNTVEMASTVHGNCISGIKAQAYSKAKLGKNSMFDFQTNWFMHQSKYDAIRIEQNHIVPSTGKVYFSRHD